MKNRFLQFLILSILSCLFPGIFNAQSSRISYDQGLENCGKQIEEFKIMYPDSVIHKLPDCLVGSQIPDFSGKTLDGKIIGPEYFKGKITIINFWYTACVPCIEEIGGLNAIVDQFGNNGINYLGICIDDDSDIPAFLHQFPWKFEQMSNGKALIFDYFKMKGWGFPSTFILDRDAKIIKAFSGGKSDERAIEEIKLKISPVLDKLLH